jgi:DUF1680 family protein
MLAAGASLLVSGRSPADESARPKPPVVALKARPFEVKDVRLLDGPFRDNQLRDLDYLLSIDGDRLLHMFRVTAGLPSTAKPLGGWESPHCRIRGHSMGHYLSACALLFASTGEQRLKTKADALVADLARCQEALPKQGCRAGYLGAIPEQFYDDLDAGRQVWAPWYVCHKIMAGLLDVYLHCGNRQALDVLCTSADWVKGRVDRLSEAHMQRALQTEFGGMNEVLANLYAVTGNPEHLRLARAFDHKAVFDPLARGRDCLDGLHANTQIPKIIGAACEYEMTGERRYRDMATFFWRNVVDQRSFVLGGNSDREHFFPHEEFPQHLSPLAMETCNTYNMLKLTGHLFAWEPSAEIMDYYERALWNHILGSTDPVKGTGIYFASVRPGSFKLYATPLDSFWCCTGTGMENPARYSESIYFHTDRSLLVNQFMASRFTWADRGLVVTQETRFPEQDSTRLTLSCKRPLTMAVQIRWPGWARGAMSVQINGHSQPIAGRPGSYVTLDRTWNDGDRIDVRLPMHLHAEALPGDPTAIALLYGPIVLAGRLGTDALATSGCYLMSNANMLWPRCPEVPVLLGDAASVLARIQPVEGKPLTFVTVGVGRPNDVTLIPYYRLHHERLNVYWRICTQEQWQTIAAARHGALLARRQLESRLVDEILLGEATQHRHKFQGRVASEAFRDRIWVESVRGGQFSFELKVQPDRPMCLRCTYWGEEREETVGLFTGRKSPTGPRLFDILIDGRSIATQRLKPDRPGEFFDVDYPLPEELTRGKTSVTITFKSHPNATAGRLFGCVMIRGKET